MNAKTHAQLQERLVQAIELALDDAAEVDSIIMPLLGYPPPWRDLAKEFLKGKNG